MTDAPRKRNQEPPERSGSRQQDLDPIGAGDRAAVDAFKQPGRGNASDTAANPASKEPDERARGGIDPRASPPFAHG